MKTIRKRYHDVGNRLNKIVSCFDSAIDFIEHSKKTNAQPDIDQILALLRVGINAAMEMNAELAAAKNITYKLCNPDDDLDHLQGKD